MSSPAALTAPVLEAARVSLRFAGAVRPAVDAVDLTLEAGAALCIVGESGSGKSTLLRLLSGLETPTTGSVRFRGVSIATAARAQRRAFRRSVQVVFQDPFASLNPVKRIEHNLVRPLVLAGHGEPARLDARVRELLDAVGLPESGEFRRRYPHELSGGQRQRVAIARALACDPEVLLADEPTSMLDVSIRATIQGLLASLQRDLGIALVYVTHDLRSARMVAPTMLVMRSGRVVERGPTEALTSRPEHPYTRALLDALPGSRRTLAQGEASG